MTTDTARSAAYFRALARPDLVEQRRVVQDAYQAWQDAERQAGAVLRYRGDQDRRLVPLESEAETALARYQQLSRAYEAARAQALREEGYVPAD